MSQIQSEDGSTRIIVGIDPAAPNGDESCRVTVEYNENTGIYKVLKIEYGGDYEPNNS